MAIDPNAGVEPVLERCEVSAARSGAGELVLHLAGAWTLHNRIPALDELRESIEPDARISRITFDWRSLAGVLLLFSLQIVGADAGAEETDVAAESYRAGQDATLDLGVDFDALHYESSDPMADNPPEGLTPGWDRHPRVDWSRRAGKSWELDPVLLHRRQAGQPDRPGDDLSNKTLGIELRRRF